MESRQDKLVARKNWLAGQLKSKGTIFIDQGAVDAIVKTGKSLLAIGSKKAEGDFERGALVDCCDLDGNLIAKGLVNYSSKELFKILGQSSDKIEELLGYINENSLIHRNNLVILKKGK